MSLTAFLRIATNPRASENPMTPSEAWSIIDGWLGAPTVWIPQPGVGHHEILRELTHRPRPRAGLVSDAVLAALCIEHGLDIVSADSDFARFRDLHWINPVAARSSRPAAAVGQRKRLRSSQRSEKNPQIGGV